MKKVFFLSVFILFSLMCSSQDFREGFIVQNDGDTIHGLIERQPGLKGYNTAKFKKDKSPEVTIYTPNDISGFGFTGSMLFESRSLNKSDKQSLSFVRVVVRGKVSLYNLDGVLYAQKNDSLFKLEITEKEIIKDGVNVIAQTKSYLGILTLLLSDSETIAPRIGNMTLDESRIAQLIGDYNSSINSPSQTFFSGEPKVRIAAGLSAGFVKSSLECSEENSTYRSNVELPYKVSKSFSAGVSFDISFPRILEKFSLHTDIAYFKSQLNGYDTYKYDIQYNRPANVEQFVKIDITQLSIPIGIKHTFMINRFSPYVSLGMLTTINLEKSSIWNRYITELSRNMPISHISGTAFKEMRSQSGYWFGCGLVLPLSKNISCSADMRYDLSKELTDPPVYCDINDLWVSFGIQFKTR